MENNFWKKLKKPIFTLAPMEDVTDTVFRELVMRNSDPQYFHVVFTEFTSTDGLCHELGRPNVISRLRVNDSEREVLKEKNTKIVAQIWGADPEKFYKATKMICAEKDFDGIDINMGCPVKKIVKQGGCSALIGQYELVKEIIRAVKDATDLPVSVKTRTGIKKHDTENWMGFLLQTGLSAIVIHARTQKDKSEKDADWLEIEKAVGLKNSIAPDTLLLGNGGVTGVEDAFEKCRRTGADGVMVGRGILHNPWFFNYPQKEISTEKKLDLLWKHVELFTNTWGKDKNFNILKRFFKIYANNFNGAARIRAALMETGSPEDVKKVLDDFRRYRPPDDEKLCFK